MPTRLCANGSAEVSGPVCAYSLILSRELVYPRIRHLRVFRFLRAFRGYMTIRFFSSVLSLPKLNKRPKTGCLHIIRELRPVDTCLRTLGLYLYDDLVETHEIRKIPLSQNFIFIFNRQPRLRQEWNFVEVKFISQRFLINRFQEAAAETII